MNDKKNGYLDASNAIHRMLEYMSMNKIKKDVACFKEQLILEKGDKLSSYDIGWINAADDLINGFFI